MIETFSLLLKPGEPTAIYKWCELQFGHEHINWIFKNSRTWIDRFGKVNRLEKRKSTFVIKGQENISLFYLTWHDKIII